MVAFELPASHYLLAKLTGHFSFFTVELEMSLHTDFIDQEISFTLMTRPVNAIDLFMFLNLTEWKYLQTVRVATTSYHGQIEDFSELWFILTQHELALFSLLAVAALTAPRLPLLDARLTVYGTFAEGAVDGDFSLWHYYFLTNHTECISEEIQAVQLFFVAYPVLSHQVWRSHQISCCLIQS